LLENLDRVVGWSSPADRRAQDEFLANIDRVEQHLAMVFHRYVDGAPPALRIFVNGRDERHRVRPWDPFLTRHPATIATPIERIQSSGGLVEVLPHRDRLSDKEFESAAGHRRVDRSAGVLCLSRPTAAGAGELAWARRNARVDEGGALQTCTAPDRLA